ncbi:hypothetical protein TI04_11940 [Achromatium sp. WMS2]|nr:hypothetical protein TI04_11940 [Achromatium sp. WMS2]
MKVFYSGKVESMIVITGFYYVCFKQLHDYFQPIHHKQRVETLPRKNIASWRNEEQIKFYYYIEVSPYLDKNKRKLFCITVDI